MKWETDLGFLLKRSPKPPPFKGMRGGQSGADLTPEMWLGEGGEERRGEEWRGGRCRWWEPGATWLHINIRDRCTSAPKGTGVQDREGWPTDWNLPGSLQQNRRRKYVHAWMSECKHVLCLHEFVSYARKGLIAPKLLISRPASLQQRSTRLTGCCLPRSDLYQSTNMANILCNLQ